MRLFGRPKKKQDPQINMWEFDSNVRELRSLIKLAEANKLKPKRIIISENVRDTLDSFIARRTPKNNLKKDILFGLPVKIQKDIQLICEEKK